VIDEEATAYFCAGVNLDSGGGAGELRDDSGQGEPAGFINAVGQAMDQDGVESGVAQHDFEHATGGGVALENGVELLSDVGEHL
jgi:hypothetical protein